MNEPSAQRFPGGPRSDSLVKCMLIERDMELTQDLEFTQDLELTRFAPASRSLSFAIDGRGLGGAV
jgi:hypothetical protein